MEWDIAYCIIWVLASMCTIIYTFQTSTKPETFMDWFAAVLVCIAVVCMMLMWPLWAAIGILAGLLWLTTRRIHK